MVVLSTIGAMLLAIVAWLLIVSRDTPAAARSPLYGMIMLPFACWAVGLASYAPWPVRWLRPARYGAPLLCMLAFGAAAWSGGSIAQTCGVLLGICLILTAVGTWFIRGSLLEGQMNGD